MIALKLPTGAWVFFSCGIKPVTDNVSHLLEWKEYERTTVIFVHIRHTTRLACVKCDWRMDAKTRSMPRYNEVHIRNDLTAALDGYDTRIEKVSDVESGLAYDAVLPLRDVVTMKLRAELLPPPF